MQANTSSYTHLLTLYHTALWCLSTRFLSSQHSFQQECPQPFFLLGYYQQMLGVTGVTMLSPMLTEGIIPQVPAAPIPLKWAPHHLGWGSATHGRGKSSAREWEILETPCVPELQAAHQLIRGFVHWNIRPRNHLWQPGASSFFRWGDHSLRTYWRLWYFLQAVSWPWAGGSTITANLSCMWCMYKISGSQ